MLTIQQGFVHDPGIKFWQIQDIAGATLTEFNHLRFRDIGDLAHVYFIDLDLDPQFCENVQPCRQVDALIERARPAADFAAGAEQELRLYVMAALLHALGKQGQARQHYLDQLDEKMDVMKADADGENRRD